MQSTSMLRGAFALTENMTIRNRHHATSPGSSWRLFRHIRFLQRRTSEEGSALLVQPRLTQASGNTSGRSAPVNTEVRPSERQGDLSTSSTSVRLRRNTSRAQRVRRETYRGRNGGTMSHQTKRRSALPLSALFIASTSLDSCGLPSRMRSDATPMQTLCLRGEHGSL